MTNRRIGNDEIPHHLSPYSTGTTMLTGHGRRLLRMAKGFGHGLGKDARPTLVLPPAWLALGKEGAESLLRFCFHAKPRQARGQSD
jgi:hypothetical protein